MAADPSAADDADALLLRRFLDGALNDEQASSLAARLEHEPALAARLEALGDDGDLPRALRDAARSASVGGGPGHPPTLPGYDELSELQRGGQGVVYAGRQVSTGRAVALKLLAPDVVASRRQEMRFEREIELSASLEHPNVVTVFDRGHTADGRRFCVMEFIDGLPIDRHADEHGLGVPERIELFDRLCAAVAYAHHRGVLHRDLKPANVLVDRAGEPRVLDFGLAKIPDADDAADDASLDPSLVTREGEFVGTLAFAAPEQLTGGGLDLDVRTDVYALGVMLYRLLTGQHPYPTTGAVGDLIQRVAFDDPPRPSRGNGALDADLDALCLTCLAKDKDGRYASVDALRADLDRWRKGLPLAARSDRRGYVLRRTLLRHRWAVAGLLLLLTSLSAATIVSLEALGEARRETRRATNLGGFLVDSLLSGVPGTLPADVTVAELVSQAGDEVGRRFPEDPESEAVVRDAIGQVLRATGRYDEAAVHLGRALELSEQRLGPEHEQTLAVRVHLARLAQGRGDPATAEALLDIVGEVLARSEASPTLRYDWTHARGSLWVRQGRPAEAVRLVREFLAERRRAGLTDREADMLTLQADALREAGDVEGALEVDREVERAMIADYGADHVFLVRTRQNQALMLSELGQLGEAIELMQAVTGRLTDELGAEHPSTLAVRINLAGMLADAGRHEQARTRFVELVDVCRRRFGDRHRATLDALHGLGVLLRRSDDVATAAALLELAHAGRLETVGADHKTTLRSQVELALAVGRSGQLGRAEALLRDAVERIDRTRPADADDRGSAHQALAALLLDTDRPGPAAELLERARADARRHPTRDPGQAGQLTQQWALALSRLGDLERAAELAEEAHAELADVLGPTAPRTRACASLAAQIHAALGDAAAAARWQAVLEESSSSE